MLLHIQLIIVLTHVVDLKRQALGVYPNAIRF